MRILEVIKTEKRQKLDKAILEKLKGTQMYKRVKFMKKELVNCPKEKKLLSPLYCMVCPYFRKRVKGKIYCDYIN